MKRIVVTTMLLVLSILPTMVVAQSTTQRITNGSADSAPPRRVRILSFDLTLSPTTGILTPSEEDTLRTQALAVVDAYMTPKALDKNLQLDYVLLSTVKDNIFQRSGNGGNNRRKERTRQRQRRLQADGTNPGSSSTTLMFSGGVASFRGGNAATQTPAQSEVYGWVADALESDLVSSLQDTELSYVSNVKFGPSTLAPSMAPSVAPVGDPIIVGGVAEQTAPDESSPNSQLIPILASVATAGLVLAVLIFLLVTRRRKQERLQYEEQQMAFYDARAGRSMESDGSEEESVLQPPLPVGPRRAPQMARSPTLDSVSLGSEFTLKTVDQEDPLHNVDANSMSSGRNGSSIGSPQRQYVMHGQSMQQETFEKGRWATPSLQKDMISTPGWSGTWVPANGRQQPYPASPYRTSPYQQQQQQQQQQREGIMLLRPNHFSAATATDQPYPLKRSDQMGVQSPRSPLNRPLPQPRQSRGPFPFDKSPLSGDGQGEEVVLIPPSQTKRGRRI